ncbi:MAG: hypothetical protein IIA49_09095 [Bacteroidetes bacterium]|nr:hypothetical protein [Bacteroidota bacterium]
MTHTKQTIKITELLINIENPRFEPEKNQKQALTVMIEKFKSKIIYIDAINFRGDIY